MAVSRRLRFEVLNRDNNTCRYCHATDAPLTIDHVIPTALGGSDDPSNLVACCRDCNAGKTSTSPDGTLVAQVSDDAIRWSRAMERAAAAMRADLAAEHAYGDALDAEWSGWQYDSGKPIPRPEGWRNSVAAWRAAGVPQDVMVDAARRALSNERLVVGAVWRYFCGIVWNKLTELQTAAREDLSKPAGTDYSADDETEWRRGFDAAFTVPLLSDGYMQARALSRVVDGENAYNRRVAV